VPGAATLICTGPSAPKPHGFELTGLWGEAHAAQQVLEARVGAQRV
jgi:hypothetical protein